jgi:hypothetical protein
VTDHLSQVAPPVAALLDNCLSKAIIRLIETRLVNPFCRRLSLCSEQRSPSQLLFYAIAGNTHQRLHSQLAFQGKYPSDRSSPSELLLQTIFSLYRPKFA